MTVKTINCNMSKKQGIVWYDT